MSLDNVLLGLVIAYFAGRSLRRLDGKVADPRQAALLWDVDGTFAEPKRWTPSRCREIATG